MRISFVLLAAILAATSCTGTDTGTPATETPGGLGGSAGEVIVPPAASGSRGIGGCRFDRSALAFPGTDAEQASCLLRKVKAKGTGATVQPMPAWLVDNVGKPVPLSRAQLDRYLGRHGISASELPGRAAAAGQLRYFVIHDTSAPEIAQAEGFPANMDAPGYPGNNLANWDGALGQRVNLITGRDGRSRAWQDWGATRSLPATKLEMNSIVPAARPVFVHVESVQPRLKPRGSWAWIAPEPGFSPQQEQRLALAYISASIAAGRWLIPAYHFNIDEGLPDAHDDPQNADLRSWAAQVAAIAEEMQR